ncbi:hypothetical protein ETAA8_50070 [Anatilimnocola aggregata]|uniref:SLA1 homology domain-containing protein n=1 Tax=Anatilimnocola aggregata TaxID=2528021 RepID=A0A517YI52_9BACT|nr:SHD1 domain-containing protein [Anatilimnocola aggregata]QDU29891.1 hypothetical protein ETAA8_50070 [Anatilimnocola aggregata]
MSNRSIISLSFVLLLISCSTLFGQNKSTGGRPDLRPGDLLQVYDEGRMKDAEFVEFTPVGLIKVRFEDDSRKAFRRNFVRWHPNAVSRENKPVAEPPAAAPVAVGGKRTWTDSTGKFKVEAAFLSLADGQVQLKKNDGKVIALPFDRLSTDDQNLAVAFSKAATKEETRAANAPANNPFEEYLIDGNKTNPVAVDVPSAPKPSTSAPPSQSPVPSTSPSTASTVPPMPEPVPEIPDEEAVLTIPEKLASAVHVNASAAKKIRLTPTTFVALSPDPIRTAPALQASSYPLLKRGKGTSRIPLPSERC